MLYRISIIFNKLIKYNFILLILIEVFYNFRIRKIFNLLQLKNLNAIAIIKVIFNNIIIIYSIIKSTTRII